MSEMPRARPRVLFTSLQGPAGEGVGEDRDLRLGTLERIGKDPGEVLGTVESPARDGPSDAPSDTPKGGFDDRDHQDRHKDAVGRDPPLGGVEDREREVGLQEAHANGFD